MARFVAIGVMSGTSADGADAVLLELESVRRRHPARVLGHAYTPYSKALRDELRRPADLGTRRLAELHFVLPEIYAKTVRKIRGWRRAEVCGMHGQTVWHAPPPARPACTFQIGSSAVLAQRLGMPVVGDLRSADLAIGGQGAPIVPYAHWFFTPPGRCPRLVVNFGGICNLTYVASRLEDVRAYDVGPGMMLSDAFASWSTGGRLDRDEDGELSRGGRVLEPLVEAIVAHPFVERPAPKSTGREDFGRHFSEPLFRRFGKERRADVAKSLLVASARILGLALERDPESSRDLREVVVSGGGAHNPSLIGALRDRLSGTTVVVARRGPLSPARHEPSAIALVAARTVAGLASSLPRVTGAPRPAILGHVHAPTATTGQS